MKQYVKLISQDEIINVPITMTRPNGEIVCGYNNPYNEHMWIADGFLPLVETVNPFKYSSPTYEKVDNQIIQSWKQLPGPTEEELMEARRVRYQNEADPFLLAYQGYMLEGNVEKAEIQKTLYIAKKQEIRETVI